YARLRKCCGTNWLTGGPKSKLFVDELMALTDVRYASRAPNGTLAIYLSLRALNIGPGDDVVVPSFTFFGSARAVQMGGATPVFCDIDPETLQATADHFAASLTARTNAIMT